MPNFQKPMQWLFAGILAISPMTVKAETLKISGLYPAGAADVGTVISIAVEPFGGTDGGALSFAAEDILSAIVIDEERYFDIISHRAAVPAQALLSGNATAGIDEYRVEDYRSRCVEWDDEGKCEKHERRKVPCKKRVIDLRATVKLADLTDGLRRYGRVFSEKHEQTRCGLDEDYSSSEGEIRKLIDVIAQKIRRDLAPIWLTQNIRILESRKGMAKPLAALFKTAIKKTKRDEVEACRMMEQAAANNPPHISIAFNIALCAERRGELETALNLYGNASAINASKAEIGHGIERVNNKIRAKSDWDARKAAL